MNNKRKNRTGGGLVRIPQSRKPLPAEGVYANSNFMHAATSQIGCIARIKTASGAVYEGIFRTFSQEFDVVLEVAVRVEDPDGPNPTVRPETQIDKLIFKCKDILSLSIRDSDMDYATRDNFQTDTAIAARLNGTRQGSAEERELEPWQDCGGGGGGVNGGGGLGSAPCLELESGANGWDAADMFRKNEQEYGVTSTFDHSLRGYTVPLQHSDSSEYREAEAKANAIAQEIESAPSHRARLEVENGDEEAAFAAVARPPGQDAANGKYIPPAKRKNHNTGKLMRSTPPPQPQPPLQQVMGQQQQQQPSGSSPSTTGSIQTSPSPKGAPLAPFSPPAVVQTAPNSSIPSGGSSGPHPGLPHGTPQQPPVPLSPAPQVIQMQSHQAPPPSQAPPPASTAQQLPPQQQQQGRPHSNTPPHYQGPQAPLRGPPAGNGGKVNGEGKQRPRPPPQAYQPGGYQVMPPQDQHPGSKPQDVHPARHPREDPSLKELHSFHADFKLMPGVGALPPPDQQQQQQQPPSLGHEPPLVPPAQPSLSKPPPLPQQRPPSPPAPDKLADTLKKSNLNPNAKEFKLDPTAKPFTPRSPASGTSSMSRPQTPGTPAPIGAAAGHPPPQLQPAHHPPQFLQGGMGAPQQPMPVMLPANYMMVSQNPYQPQPPNNRMRKLTMGQMRLDSAQMQVAQATGAPILAASPLQHVYYQQVNQPTATAAYQQVQIPAGAMRVFEGHPGAQIQFLQQAGPPGGPTALQPGPQGGYQGPGGPPQGYQTLHQPGGHPGGPSQSFGMMCPILPTQPAQMVAAQGMQYLPPPHQQPQHQLPQLLMPQHHPSHGPPGQAP